MIGLSGGPDSVCLFFALHELSLELGLRGITCVHVNHMLRPGDADADRAYCEALCREMGTDCKVVTFDCNAAAAAQGITCEEAGRQKRYEAFDEAAAAAAISGPVKIAVAHNADDQAETLLFRILRGTGPDGLAAMQYSRKSKAGFDVIRPLLDTTRAEVEAFCEQNGLKPRTDESNLAPVYTRNKIRLELLPYLAENFNPNIKEALVRLAAAASEDRDFMQEQATTAYAAALRACEPGRIELGRTAVQQLHPALRKRVLLMALAACGLEKDIERVHIAAADRLVMEGAAGKTAEFPGGFRLCISAAGAAIVAPDYRSETRCVKLRATEMTHADYEAKRASYEDTNTVYAAFDAAKLAALGAPPVLRTRRAGDRIAIAKADGSIGSKKLQDLFTDLKIPSELRDSIPVVACGNEIICVAPLDLPGCNMRMRCSANYAISADCDRIVLLEISRGLC